VQEALSKPGSITLDQYGTQLWAFLAIAMKYILVAVVLNFFVKHFIFRWRTALNDYYMAYWGRLRVIEGAAQRVQEDTMRFARIMEGLGVDLMRSVMTLIAFLPILWELSEKVTALPLIGPVPHSLVWVALFWAIFGTVLLAVTGILLPGLEFQNQRVEAAYRKELVFGEENPERAAPPTVAELFRNVRKNYFRLFFHYLYFDVAKYSYIQVGVIVPMIAIGPTVVAGAITFGVIQKVLSAFDQVTSSLQYLALSWSTIIELVSVYKRLRGFEAQIDMAPDAGVVA
jgi:peptide/bleomycin uptake transporter